MGKYPGRRFSAGEWKTNRQVVAARCTQVRHFGPCLRCVRARFTRGALFILGHKLQQASAGRQPFYIRRAARAEPRDSGGARGAQLIKVRPLKLLFSRSRNSCKDRPTAQKQLWVFFLFSSPEKETAPGFLARIWHQKIVPCIIFLKGSLANIVVKEELLEKIYFKSMVGREDSSWESGTLLWIISAGKIFWYFTCYIVK